MVRNGEPGLREPAMRVRDAGEEPSARSGHLEEAMEEAHSAINALAESRQRTLAAESARIEALVDLTWRMPERSRRRRGGLMRPMAAVSGAAGKRLLKAVTGNRDFRHLSGEGVVDLAQRRYMVDFGSWACLHVGGTEWSGRSGRRVDTLTAHEHDFPAPLWLLDVLAGVTSATHVGTEDVRGTPCQRVAATTDLARASQMTPGGLAVPVRRRFEELSALPVDVWLDESYVRRTRFKFDERTETLDLWDFGVPIGGFDWTRLPTFRSPQEAALLAGTQVPTWKRHVHRLTRH